MSEERTAVHEAGHTVAFWMAGMGIRHATIVPSDGWLGHVQPAAAWSPVMASQIAELCPTNGLAEAFVNLAGYAAEEAVGFPYRTNIDGTPDITRARATLGDGMEAFNAQVRRILALPEVKTAILDMGAALMDARTLDHTGITALCSTMPLTWVQKPYAVSMERREPCAIYDPPPQKSTAPPPQRTAPPTTDLGAAIDALLATTYIQTAPPRRTFTDHVYEWNDVLASLAFEGPILERVVSLAGLSILFGTPLLCLALLIA